MPKLVRAGLRYNRWLETEGRRALDLPADVLADLKTTGDELSVFEVSDAVSAERIAIAFFAVSAREPDHTAYEVLDQADVEKLGITVSKQVKPGNTPDETVNALHRDLQVGTAGKLLDFAGLIADGKIVPILKERVAELLKDGFETGRLDHTKNPRLCDRVKAQIPLRRDAPPVIEE